MSKSLLFIPDISGFTEFVQTTEVEHSQHVISELLETLIEANTLGLKLAEIEGDALFFYLENKIPSKEELMAQVEAMNIAFHKHLQLLKTHRICPCKACVCATELQLKIVAHSAELSFIRVQKSVKPFGKEVIEVHRLLKNSIDSDNYVLISEQLATDMNLSSTYSHRLFAFENGLESYDGNEIKFMYANINKHDLEIPPVSIPQTLEMNAKPNIKFERTFSVSAKSLLEFITNYSYRPHWAKDVDKMSYRKNEVTRLGTEHSCIINDQLLDFTVVKKKGNSSELVYGEFTSSFSLFDKLYIFYVITPLSPNTSSLQLELYWKTSPLKKVSVSLFGRKNIKELFEKALRNLRNYITSIVSSDYTLAE